jgi:hypothetical protein
MRPQIFRMRIADIHVVIGTPDRIDRPHLGSGVAPRIAGTRSLAGSEGISLTKRRVLHAVDYSQNPPIAEQEEENSHVPSSAGKSVLPTQQHPPVPEQSAPELQVGCVEQPQLFSGPSGGEAPQKPIDPGCAVWHAPVQRSTVQLGQSATTFATHAVEVAVGVGVSVAVADTVAVAVTVGVAVAVMVAVAVVVEVADAVAVAVFVAVAVVVGVAVAVAVAVGVMTIGAVFT